MWVSPLSSVQKIIEAAIGHASGGHTAAGFFDGVVYEDGSIPLWVLHYYPTTYLWRISPPVLLGLLLVVFVLWKRVAPLDERSARKTVVTLISYAVFFMLFMNLGSTKGDRYVVPVYPALDLVAAVGWVGLAKYSIARFGLRELEAWRRHAAVWMALGLVGLFQLLAYVSVFPYPLSYYNPLLGGGKRAPAVMQIGWGEGLDEAGRYLSKKPESKKLVVASWYRSVLAYHFDGKTKLVSSTMKSTRFKKVDYLVLYVHQWQRNLPAPLLEKFARRKPEHVVEINGIEYAKIYKLRKRAKRGADGG
jgi:4-amino-4-deoxy-L-arabinose transferase-like glycosyltransferase